ncbi:MAG: metallophosphatase family protein [Nitrososphaerota archaeon]|jgi:putative phosphoesterase|uniref:metallophosphoesterase family protein n=1 Tax=Candidatus Bathycorpusculum sp. TaxID=2994959 RepID=UPI00282302DE|nr:metallophosphatase family protein [Candidatus Termitimicrobium sp.]MCL2431943.1 metallophosphatase family protein [Candidatus Termitimicrobium sp.]MDR0493867.1 metallophosphatase family protein [Nitrososphaerota archaeon]
MISETKVALSQHEPSNIATKTIGLISDTHIPKRAHYLPKRVFELFEKVDYIIHAGDLVELAVVDELEQFAPVLAVHGNMDNMAVTGALPRLNSIRLFDWKIGVMHDPDIHFGLDKMRKLTKQNGFNVFVYGHTHVANIKWENKTLYINPGSPTVPPSIISKPSVGLLKITKDTISPQIIEF